MEVAVSRKEIADELDTIAALIEIEAGTNHQFRSAAYRKAALSVRETEGSLAEPEALVGVGKSIALSIKELMETGTCIALLKLTRTIPRSVTELLSLRGVGPAKARALLQDDITSIDDLEQALSSGVLEDEKLASALTEWSRNATSRIPRLMVSGLVDELVLSLQDLEGVEATPAGSWRRGCPSVRDLDLVVAYPNSWGVAPLDRLRERFFSFGKVLTSGKKACRIQVDTGDHLVSVDLTMVPKESAGAALCYLTGSKDHNISTRRIAIEKGYNLNL